MVDRRPIGRMVGRGARALRSALSSENRRKSPESQVLTDAKDRQFAIDAFEKSNPDPEQESNANATRQEALSRV